MRYEIRFNLGAGKYHMMWKITDRVKGKILYLLPDEVQLKLTDCKLVNRASTARKIYDGGHKQVCAFVLSNSYEILKQPVPVVSPVLYNPRVAPNWRNLQGENLDNFMYKTLITSGRTVYVRS